MAIINKIQVNDINYDIQGKELTKITYAELKDLRDNNQLKEGHFYRIIDYSGPINGAKHKFDIIVQALSTNTLSENAQAIQNDDNNYFNNNNLNVWKLKYCLDVDDKRFASPYFIFQGIMLDDPEDGEQLYFSEIQPKHYTPYWEYTTDPSTDEPTITLYEEFEGMKDTGDKYFYRGVVTVDGIEYDCWQKWESSNIRGDNLDGFDYTGVFFEASCVYYLSTRVVFDNKVIFPMAHGIIYYMKDEFDNEAWYDFKNTLFDSKYTFSYQTEDLNILDYSLLPNCRNNIIHRSTITSTPKVILQIDEEDGEIYNNIFLADCTNIKLTAYDISNNTFGTKCHDIILNPGNDIRNNIFDRSCYNIISDSDYSSFSNNTFSWYCHDIIANGEIQGNIFGDECQDIQLNYECYGNIFGIGCSMITLGSYNDYNVFKDYCLEIQFGNENSSNICGTFCRDINIGDCNKNIRFESSCENIILPYNYLNNIQFKNDCHNISFSNVTSTKDNPLQNIIIGPSIYDEEVHFESGIETECILTKKSNGDTVQFYLADLVQ